MLDDVSTSTRTSAGDAAALFAVLSSARPASWAACGIETWKYIARRPGQGSAVASAAMSPAAPADGSAV